MKRALIALLLLCSFPLLAKEASPLADDPMVEARLMKISKELRCLVCQNETLADSQADLAKDLRREVRGKIAQGLSDEQIKTYLTQRYGDFVLYRPRFNLKNAVLWLGPFLMLLGIAFGVVRYIKGRQREQAADAPLTPEEEAKLKTLLPKEGEGA